jgi:hypothetical protein
MSVSAQLSRPSPTRGLIWPVLRVLALGTISAVVLTLFLRPETGLTIFWCLVVPALPLWFLVAPGFWRNICPLATLNQTPRRFGWGHPRPLPPALRRTAPLAGFVLFLALAAGRKLLFNADARALAALLIALSALALLGGLRFAGKSGWCASICPVLPVQRLYGKSALITVEHRHCRPCVGCIRRCYDLRPELSAQSDSASRSHRPVVTQNIVAGAFPGFILAFSTTATPPAVQVWQLVVACVTFMAVSGAIFWLLGSLVHVPAAVLSRLYAAIAFALYYWLTASSVAVQLQHVWGWTVPAPVVWVTRLLAVILSAFWLWRSRPGLAAKELQAQPSTGHRLTGLPSRSAAPARAAGWAKAASTRRSQPDAYLPLRAITAAAGHLPDNMPPPAA